MNARRLGRLIRLRSRLEREQEERLQLAARHRDGRAQVVSERNAHKAALLRAPEPPKAQPVDLESSALYLHRIDRELNASRAGLQHSLVELARERVALLARRRDRSRSTSSARRAKTRRRARAVHAERDRRDEHVAHSVAVSPRTQRRGTP